MSVFAALQPLIVGAVLVWAAVVKLTSRAAAREAQRSGLANLVGESRALPAYRLVGVVETVVGLALVTPPHLAVEGWAAAGVATCFLGYLTYLRVTSPESSCGCMSAKPTPVTWRSFVRGAVLVAAALGAAVASGHWYTAFAANPMPSAAVVVGELLLIGSLSAEFDGAWLVPLRRLRIRLSHPLAGQPFQVPLEFSVEQLTHSPVYRAVSGMLRTDIRDWWDDDKWRVVCYGARFPGEHGQDRAVTAVFAVPQLRYEPDAVRVALVDESDATTVFTLDASQLPAGPRTTLTKPDPAFG